MLNKILDHLFGPEIEEFDLKEEGKPVQILVIEDLHTIHELKKISTPRGISIEYSSNIFEAISKINSGKINAILAGDEIQHVETLDDNLSKRFGDLIIFRMGKDSLRVNTYLLKPFDQKAYLQTLIQLRNLSRFQSQQTVKVKKIA